MIISPIEYIIKDQITERLYVLNTYKIIFEAVRLDFDLRGVEKREWCPFCPCRSRRLGGFTGVPRPREFRASLMLNSATRGGELPQSAAKSHQVSLPDSTR